MKQSDMKDDHSFRASDETSDIENSLPSSKRINIENMSAADIVQYYIEAQSPVSKQSLPILKKIGSSQEKQADMQKSNSTLSIHRPLSASFNSNVNIDNMLERQLSISIETLNLQRSRVSRRKESEKIEEIQSQEEDIQSRKIWILYRIFEMQLNLNDAEQYLIRIDLLNSSKIDILQQTAEYCLLIKEMHFNLWKQNYSKDSLTIPNSKYLFPQFLFKDKKSQDLLPIQQNNKSIQMQSYKSQYKRQNTIQMSVNLTKKLLTDGMKCSICCEENLDPQQFIQASDDCSHIFCQSCLYKYVYAQLDNGNISSKGISCPYDNCSTIYTNTQLKTITQNDQKFIEKYLKFKSLAELNHSSHIRFCIKPDCSGYMNEKEDTLNLQCPLCKSEICSRCFTFWHQGLTCQDTLLLKYKEMKSNEVDCPKCQHSVQQYARHLKKNKIYCTWCHYKFCKLCKKQATYLHYNKYNCLGRCRIKNFPPISLLHLLKLLIKYIFLAILAFIIYPIYLIIMGICLPLVYYFNLNESTFGQYRMIKIPLLLIIGVAMFPLWVLLSIAPGTCIIIHKTKYNMLMMNQDKNNDGDDDDDFT